MPGVRALIAGIAVVAAVAFGAVPASAASAVATSTTVASTVVPGAARDASKTSIVPAADLRQFNPGNIISDEVFFNPATMSEADIDSFIRSKVSSCVSGYVCLKDFRQNTANKPADAYCDGYAGAGNESAARIIYKVAVACGINPQAILVTLQKEQSLITNVWPDPFRYTAAMGHNCPDTAACDPRFAGFQNQVYGAARQFQIYAEGRYFTYYAPGKTWNILYNPTRACGSSPVYIANRATAGLYYYTPYQPNPAAIAAGYGTGDKCSAHGNRNFYQYFVDWFGSTQTSNMTIVKTAANADVFLISGGNRWRIADGESYGELVAAYGPLRVVTDSALKTFSLQGTTTSVLRDGSTGTMAIVQGGQTHRIPTCELVAIWGSSCASPTTVSSTLFTRLPAGAEAGAYFQVRGSTTWGRFDSATSSTPLYDSRAAAAVNKTPNAAPYAPFISASRYSSLKKSAPYYAPLTLVKATTDAKVYMTVDFDKLVWIKSFEEVAEYGVGPGTLAVVPSASLSRYRDSGQAVKVGLRCGDATYLVAGGRSVAVASPATVGLPTLTAAAETCAQLPAAPAGQGTALAIKTADSPSVFVLEAGKRRAVLSWQLLIAANGGTPPQVATVRASTMASFAVGPAIADGQVVKATNSPDIMLISGTAAMRIPSAAVAADLGLSLAFTTLRPEELVGYAKSGDLGPVVTCAAGTYLAASGSLWPVSAQVADPQAALSASACARFALKAGPALDQVFVKSQSSGDVYLISRGKSSHISSWSSLVALAGTSSPRILVLTPSSLAWFPKGAGI